MLPFRAYDRERKITWLIVNFQPQEGLYLAAREDDSAADGELSLLPAEKLKGLRLIGFVDDED